MNKMLMIGGAAAALALGGCAYLAAGPSDAEVVQTLKSSFRDKGIAKLDRLDQTELQKACSAHAQGGMPDALREQLERAALAAVKPPADGNYLGDWRSGEKIAQSGRGLQFSDNEKTVNGGNCYACHQLSKQEMAYGNIGPSLYNYGKLRGNSKAVLEYTWGKLWSADAYAACSQMPRFGDAGILTTQQLRDVMALLLDPASPINQ
ncbi:sulfur oxidation c-type cytochrome SoxX [Quisquiliibacterium transsilvanicum]|uniref:Sulfur-oxidizing protein SoxX n=1 Tax=Quisquiliibacterium transsilvanicum TaxID=1549638 RepID=A0A7W8M805_9BURK|nr:sulfur-oxidizing protein SoxX [Quisquiliibacterium transsilvanicum]